MESNGHLDYYPMVLSQQALQILDVAITTKKPDCNYDLAKVSRFASFRILNV